MTDEANPGVVTEHDIDTIVRHIFLQTMMKRSYVPIDEAREILDGLGEAAVGRGAIVCICRVLVCIGMISGNA